MHAIEGSFPASAARLDLMGSKAFPGGAVAQVYRAA
jgi:hypothetical protein